MATQNPNATALLEYVEQEKLGLIAKSVLVGRTLNLIKIQSGVKSSATINLLDTDVEFQSGETCGWTEAGSSTLTQRKIETGQIKINMAFCEKNLLKTFAEHKLSVAAGKSTLPFEQEFINGILNDIQYKKEVAVWQGDTLSEDANKNKFDGFIKIIDNAEGVIDSAIEPGTTVYAAIRKVNSLIPQIARREDTAIFVGEDTFVKLIDEMIDKNLYHYNADNDGKSFKLPGFDVMIEAVAGLNGTNRIFAGRKSNFYFGCDLSDDSEKFEFWYSQDSREFRLAVEFNGGVQVAFPDQIVKGALS